MLVPKGNDYDTARMAELLEESSLGTEAARALRSRISDERASRVLAGDFDRPHQEALREEDPTLGRYPDSSDQAAGFRYVLVDNRVSPARPGKPNRRIAGLQLLVAAAALLFLLLIGGAVFQRIFFDTPETAGGGGGIRTAESPLSFEGDADAITKAALTTAYSWNFERDSSPADAWARAVFYYRIDSRSDAGAPFSLSTVPDEWQQWRSQYSQVRATVVIERCNGCASSPPDGNAVVDATVYRSLVRAGKKAQGDAADEHQLPEVRVSVGLAQTPPGNCKSLSEDRAPAAMRDPESDIAPMNLAIPTENCDGPPSWWRVTSIKSA